jgi:3-hydroxyisobutyrate dehydrogenase-like beta-hydroxyacid dehydrogenase
MKSRDVVLQSQNFHMDAYGPWIAANDYQPRFAVDLTLKDLRLGLEMAMS